jgi:hypothetical protein
MILGITWQLVDNFSVWGKAKLRYRWKSTILFTFECISRKLLFFSVNQKKSCQKEWARRLILEISVAYEALLPSLFHRVLNTRQYNSPQYTLLLIFYPILSNPVKYFRIERYIFILGQARKIPKMMKWMLKAQNLIFFHACIPRYGIDTYFSWNLERVLKELQSFSWNLWDTSLSFRKIKTSSWPKASKLKFRTQVLLFHYPIFR